MKKLLIYFFMITTPPSVWTAPAGAKFLYSVGVDPKTGLIFCGDALDFKGNGVVYMIDPTTKAIKKTLNVGVGPNGFLFQ